MTALKPGTRCECVGEDHRTYVNGLPQPGEPRCTRDAVRFVLLPDDGGAIVGKRTKLMCGPCADWHEAKEAR